jgi:nickel-type superoxide dismutase maturation protease
MYFCMLNLLERQNRMIRRVEGISMIPTLKPGTIVVAVKAKRLRVGNVVIAELDGRDVIKRIARIDDGMYHLLGDNLKSSTDSRTKGSIDRSKIHGFVIWPRVNR